MIVEGGGFGHLNHPFDVDEFTFADLADIIDKSLSGKLSYVREKSDGQNLLVSFKDGRIIAARNTGQLKNFGASAKSIDGVQKMFAGRGTIEFAFVEAVKSLQSAIGGLTDKQLQKIFANGHKFMSVEVMHSTQENVIHYGFDQIRFHGTIEYDVNGRPISQLNKDDGRILAGMIKQINQVKQKHFDILPLDKLKLPSISNLKAVRSELIGALTKIRSEFGLPTSATVAEYRQKFWEKQVADRFPDVGDPVARILVNRWANRVKQPSIVAVAKMIDPDIGKEIRSFDKTQVAVVAKRMQLKFEVIFLKTGAEVLKTMTKFMAINPDKTIQKMKDDLESSADKILKSKDPALIDKLNFELRRLQSIGGVDAIVPTEGITFFYKGELLKLTGAFASINQILGLTWRIKEDFDTALVAPSAIVMEDIDTSLISDQRLSDILVSLGAVDDSVKGTKYIIRGKDRYAARDQLESKLKVAGISYSRKLTGSSSFPAVVVDTVPKNATILFKPVGGRAAASSTTSFAESAFCMYIISTIHGKGTPVDLIDNKQVIQPRTDISPKTYDAIVKFLGSDEGWDDASRASAIAVYNKFKSKLSASTIAHRGSKSFNGLYSEFNRLTAPMAKAAGLKISGDKWNPSDVWLMDASLSMGHFDTLDEYNQWIADQFDAGKLMGISLKRANPSNVKIQRVDPADPINIDYVGIDQPTKILSSGDSYLLTSAGRIQFRSFNSLGSVQGEIKGKLAAGGKVGNGAISLIIKTFTKAKLTSAATLKKYSVDQLLAGIEKSYRVIGVSVNSRILRQAYDIEVNKPKQSELTLFKRLHSKYQALEIAAAISSSTKSQQKQIVSGLYNYAASRGIEGIFQHSLFHKVY